MFLTDETKKAIQKTLSIGKVLFSMKPKDFGKLVKGAEELSFPTERDLDIYLQNGYSIEDAVILEMRKRYANLAVSHGYTKKHGEALLEYVSIIKDMG
jgi:hypothetical protein